MLRLVSASERRLGLAFSRPDSTRAVSRSSAARGSRASRQASGVLQDALDTTGILDAIEQSEGRAALFPGLAFVSEQGERLGPEGVHERLVLCVAERDERVTGDAIPVERGGELTLRHGDQALDPAGAREQEDVRLGSAADSSLASSARAASSCVG